MSLAILKASLEPLAVHAISGSQSIVSGSQSTVSDSESAISSSQCVFSGSQSVASAINSSQNTVSGSQTSLTIGNIIGPNSKSIFSWLADLWVSNYQHKIDLVFFLFMI